MESTSPKYSEDSAYTKTAVTAPIKGMKCVASAYLRPINIVHVAKPKPSPEMRATINACRDTISANGKSKKAPKKKKVE